MTVLSLEKSVYRYVMGSGIPAQLITDGLLGYDPLTGDTGFEDGWIFAGADQNGNPYRNVIGTGRCAVVLSSVDEWAIPANFRTSQYPRLHLLVFSDPSRDDSGQPIARDAEDRARQVWRALHPLFHDAANRIHSFDTLNVVSTLQGGTWAMMDVPNGDGAVRGDCTYNLHL